MPRVVVDVTLKPEILDPQGQAVHGALPRLGFTGITSVRQGKRFELETDGEVTDEVLTPDSSRFWSADDWLPGRAQPSYDKQIVRNWLLSPQSGWDRSSGEPPPPLPDEVVERTRSRYVEAFTRLTGQSF